MTLEEYIIQRLTAAEARIDKLTTDLAVADSIIAEKTAALERIGKLFSIGHSISGDKYVHAEPPWEKYDAADYDFIVDLFGLEEEEEEEAKK